MNRERVKISQDIAAAVAQEMRNPVFGIASAAQLLRYRVADDPVMERNIGRILREAERLNALIAALLDFGRPAPIDPEPADPDIVWADVLARLRGALESKAILVRHTAAEPRCLCAIDTEQLARACTNLLTNAVEAVPEGSDLSIVSARNDDDSWTSSLHNDGPSIPAEIRSRVFDPLVTSKPGHAGMGLAAAHRIVAEHGGSLALVSETGSGTSVTITLPAAPLP